MKARQPSELELAPCEHRKQARPGQYTCQFLEQFTGLVNSELCAVPPQTCLACMNWHPPVGRELNPVLASLVYRACSSVAKAGGNETLPVNRALELRRHAASWIPDEIDTVSVAEDTLGQQNLSLASPAQLVPFAERRPGPKVQHWSVGVTTAPRDQTTLASCLESLAIAGWKRPRIFADGDVDPAALPATLPTTHRQPKVGAWSSWYLALSELLYRQPDADAYMMVQDDVVFYRHPGLRHYLEEMLWPTDKACIISLFCSRAYTAPEAGWHRLEEALAWGGQTLIFSRQTVIALLSDPWILSHRFRAHGNACIDGVIGHWAKSYDIPVYLPTPSLVQHIGHVSALWPGARALHNRRAEKFAGGPADTCPNTPADEPGG